MQALELTRGSNEEVGRSLYKLIFQQLLLLETNNKMVVAVYHAALDNRVSLFVTPPSLVWTYIGDSKT